MATIKVRYLVAKVGRNGRRRHYWQPSKALQAAGWRTTRLPGDEGAAIVEAGRVNARLDAWREGESRAIAVAADTLGALIDAYRAGMSWRRLAPESRRAYGTALEAITAWAGDRPVRSLTRRQVAELYRALHGATPAKARLVIAVLRRVLQHGLNEGWLDINPALKPEIVGAPPRQAVWPPALIAAFVAAADAAGRPSLGTAVIAAVHLCQRRGDLLRLAWTDWKDGRFRIRQQKTGRVVMVRAHPRLVDRLASADGGRRRPGPILISETTGKPYTGSAFNGAFGRIRARVALDHPAIAGLRFHDLRRTGMVRMAEAGVATTAIAAVSGHSIERTERILETYIPRTTAMADRAIDLWSRHDAVAAHEAET